MLFTARTDCANLTVPLAEVVPAENVTVAGPDELGESGYLWDWNRKQLGYKPAVVVENQSSGWVVGFVTDPTFRGFIDGENVLFLNAVFRAPAGGHGFGQQE